MQPNDPQDTPGSTPPEAPNGSPEVPPNISSAPPSSSTSTLDNGVGPNLNTNTRTTATTVTSASTTTSLAGPVSTADPSAITTISSSSTSSSTSSTPSTSTPLSQPPQAQLPQQQQPVEGSSTAINASPSTALPIQTSTSASPPTASTNDARLPQEETTRNSEPGQQPTDPFPPQSSVPSTSASNILDPSQSTPTPRLGQDDDSVARGPGSIPQDPAMPISNTNVNKGLLPAKTTLDTSASTASSTSGVAASDGVSQPPAPRPTNGNSDDAVRGPLGANRPERPINSSRPQDSDPLDEPTGAPEDAGRPDDDSTGRSGGGSGNGNGIANLKPASDGSNRSHHTLSTGGIVGVSIGSFVVVSLVIVLVLLWRKKSARRRGNRMLSPFSRGTDRDPATDSVGPMADAVAFDKERSHFGSAFPFNSGNAIPRAAIARASMAKPDSQLPAASQAPRLEQGTAASRPALTGLTVKDRVVDWWSRKAEDKEFDERVRDNRRAASNISRGISMPHRGIDPRPEFLPGLHFGLDGSETWDPFSDSYATTESVPYRTQTGLAVEAGAVQNPFADVNVVPTPLHMHRTDQSNAAMSSPWVGRSPSAASHKLGRAIGSPSSVVLRESLQSNESFADRRDKFRSDPFDLELESRLIPSATAIAEMPHHTGSSLIQSNELRHGSIASSRYTSGVTASEWGDVAPFELPMTSTRREGEQSATVAGSERGGASYVTVPTVGQAI
ncbi:hypothetical protein CDD81_2609 [Ophiocordyceps australis]|uniref:Uncharacterized protein n=1 Tax=Ophiocordyceps australis TaxID=1399860 RepID=A0A2C5XYP9_9HYPO|nr:hypothetical protein CDD81_2609 [Ophiocordyceps australis]